MSQEFLELENPSRRIAYNKVELSASAVTLVFLSGLKSDKDGTKAQYVEGYAKRSSLNCVRFDYQGHGQSSGDFVDGSISLWQQDTVAVIDQLTAGPLVLVGSSMGGWQMLLAALNRPDRVKALVGIAPAPDFTQELMEDKLPPEAILHLNNGNVFEVPSEEGESGFPITRRFLDDGRDNRLLDKSINIPVPIHILHGLRDTAVPLDVSNRIIDKVTSEQAYLHIVKDGDHRLSREQDLELLGKILDLVS